jgi:hypothetical protein
MIGHIEIENRSLEDVLSETSIDITVIEQGVDQSVPSRITIVDEYGVLQTVRTATNEDLAVRPGYVYTAHGKATVMLPVGQYTLYAGRGFEYSIDSLTTTLKAASISNIRSVYEKKLKHQDGSAAIPTSILLHIHATVMQVSKSAQ